MYLLGYDLGSSSVKASIIDVQTGSCLASAFYPKQEMEIKAERAGWAEQDPKVWWDNLVSATREVLSNKSISPNLVKSIGISYQMHGLVVVDKNGEVLRPSIIWCDSRAVEVGDRAFSSIGKEKCLSHLLNSPGNFTASKLKWVMENEPRVYEKIDKFMLPGDYIAFRLTGEISTTVSGLSEGMFWDFANHQTASFLLGDLGIDSSLVPKINPTFSVQGQLSAKAAAELGLKAGTSIAYRAGDQPNNAFSLNVLNPGEIAATAGTSGVVYGVSGDVRFDPQSRVNTFAHVTHQKDTPRLGVLLCVNGTGILNSWTRRNVLSGAVDYPAMNSMAEKVPIGSEGLTILPFGNGVERMLGNRNLGCIMANLNFNIHNQAHVTRAAQEGIVFSLYYGIKVMQGIGIKPAFIRAGLSNMFLSQLFRNTLAGVSGATIELYDTDGSLGAARGAGVGSGIYRNCSEAFLSLKKLQVVEPDAKNTNAYQEAYQRWEDQLVKAME